MEDKRVTEIKKRFKEFADNIVKSMAADTIANISNAVVHICDHLHLDDKDSYYIAEQVSELCVNITALQCDWMIELVSEIIKTVEKEGLC